MVKADVLEATKAAARRDEDVNFILVNACVWFGWFVGLLINCEASQIFFGECLGSLVGNA